MKKSVWLGGLLGGVAMYVVVSISWMALPFHNNALLKFKDEAAVTSAIAANVAGPGMYMLPKGHGEAEMKQWQTGPTMFAAVRTGGNTSMFPHLAIQLVGTLVAGVLIAWMLSRTSGLKFWDKVGFVTAVGAVAGILVLIPEWNWFGFSIAHIGVQFLDLIVGWFAGGWVMAKIMKK